MRYLLDSTVVIDFVTGHGPGEEMISRLFAESGDLYTCDVVTCEVLSKGDPPEVAHATTLLDALEFVALDPDGARWAGARRREQLRGGSRRHLGDALIAALAWRLGATVVTRNPRDFDPYGIQVLGYGPPLP